MSGSVRQLLDQERVLSRRDEWKLFSSLRLESGIYKTTVPGRLRDVDEAMIECWPAGTPLREVLDVGVSSGTTSMEWLQALQRAGFTAKMIATDLLLNADLLSPLPGYRVLLDRHGKPMQHLILGLSVRPWRRRLDYVTQYWGVVAAANALFAFAVRSGAVARARRGGTEILLVAPQVAASPDIIFHEDDIFASNPSAFVGRFDVVRSANLLTIGLFDPEMLRRAIVNIKERLAGPGSLLVIARTIPAGKSEQNHATIFRLNHDDRFQVSRRVRQGSEIEDLVLSV